MLHGSRISAGEALDYRHQQLSCTLFIVTPMQVSNNQFPSTRKNGLCIQVWFQLRQVTLYSCTCIFFSLQFSENMFQLAKYIQHKTCLDENRRCFELGKISQPVQDHLFLILFHLFIGGSCGRKTAYCCHQRRHGGLRGLASSCESKFCRGFGICHTHVAFVPQTFFRPNLYRVKDIDVVHDVPKHFFRRTYRHIDII